MNITEYAASRGHELEEVKEHITIHHRSKLSLAEIEMLDVALDPSFNPISVASESIASGNLEPAPIEEPEVEEVVGEMMEATQFKPDWATEAQWLNIGTRVYKIEEKLRKFNGK